MATSDERIIAAFAHGPAVVIGLAVIWDWVLRLWGWVAEPHSKHIDLFHYLYFGQRLAAGELLWTQEYNDRLPVDQFVWWLPGMLHSVQVWQAMSMAACLLGAWAVYVILRDIFSAARGFSPQLGYYAGLYGGVFTLYLFAVLAEHNNGGLHQINVLPVTMALVAVVLTKQCVNKSAGGVKISLAFLLACFCGSVAIGLRPYLLFFVALIPAWVAIVAQLDGQLDQQPVMRGGGDEETMTGYKKVARFVLLWNACLALFFFCINALPYIVSGQWEAFVAGISMLAQDVSWNDNLPQIVYRTMRAIQTQDILSNLLFFAGGLFAFILIGMVIVLRLGKTTPGPSPAGLLSGVVLFELGLLIVIVPLSIEVMILSKRFWLHYAQLFAPFAAIATVAFGVLIHQTRPWLLAEPAKRTMLLLAFAIALPLAFGSASNLHTQPQHSQPNRTPQNLQALLDELGQEGDFLAPYNIYVHWKLQQHRYGFPHVVHSMRITGATPWGIEEWQAMQIPARFHLPTTLQEYCQMIDDQGPRLIVFFAHPNAEADNHNPLLECQLQQYDLHDVSPGTQLHDVTHYFLRRQ